jgi:tetratricopeptide (TPR) repeat protein
VEAALQTAPESPWARCRLGWLQLQAGEFETAVETFGEATRLASAAPDWVWPTEQWFVLASECWALEDNAMTFAEGDYMTEDQHELAILARICDARGMHATASRIYAKYVTYDVSANDERVTTYLDRYRGVRAAALAATVAESRKERLEHRERAYTRLRKLIAFCRRYLVKRHTEIHPLHEVLSVQRWTRVWLRDPALAHLRDVDESSEMTETEKEGWRRFWSEVRELRDQTRTARR